MRYTIRAWSAQRVNPQFIENTFHVGGCPAVGDSSTFRQNGAKKSTPEEGGRMKSGCGEALAKMGVLIASSYLIYSRSYRVNYPPINDGAEPGSESCFVTSFTLENGQYNTQTLLHCKIFT